MVFIKKKERLNPEVVRMVIDCPMVAAKALPGQFIILRIDEMGERIPLTVSDYDREAGTVTIIFQEVGKTTKQLGQMEAGQTLLNFVGPLGNPSHLDGKKKVAVVGGGLGTAIAYPQAKYLYQSGTEVHVVAGFRKKDLIILQRELEANSDRCIITTDDGSNGNKGFVTDALKALIEEGNAYDEVIAIGPLVMMKFVAKLTKPYGIKTTVSMNTIMIDGTGMCGCCRLTVGGETRFACVDGPDFDGHLVDFDEAMRRSVIYKDEERQSAEAHACRLYGRE